MTYMRVRAADDIVEPEMSITPLRGYRVWRYVRPDGRLTGMTYHRPWNPGTNVAGCADGPTADVFIHIAADRQFLHPNRPAPQADCQCGFYACDRFDMFDNSTEAGSAVNDPVIAVAGVVEGFGRVLRHSVGWRAEKARIVAFVDICATTACAERGCDCREPNPAYHRVLNHLTAKYRVPLLTERPADPKGYA